MMDFERSDLAFSLYGILGKRDVGILHWMHRWRARRNNAQFRERYRRVVPLVRVSPAFHNGWQSTCTCTTYFNLAFYCNWPVLVYLL